MDKILGVVCTMVGVLTMVFGVAAMGLTTAPAALTALSFLAVGGCVTACISIAIFTQD